MCSRQRQWYSTVFKFNSFHPDAGPASDIPGRSQRFGGSWLIIHPNRWHQGCEKVLLGDFWTRPDCSSCVPLGWFIEFNMPIDKFVSESLKKKKNSRLDLQKKMALNIYSLTAFCLLPFLDKSKLSSDLRKTLISF